MHSRCPQLYEAVTVLINTIAITAIRSSDHTEYLDMPSLTRQLWHDDLYSSDRVTGMSWKM